MRTPAVTCALLMLAALVSAQEVTVAVEARRDRLEYHFDNPSTFDTSAPVPHFFEQRYAADNVWLVATGRYGRWETSIGATPSRGTTADDFDTFFDPDGTVWVSGTTGPARAQSISIEQFATIAGGFRRGPGDVRHRAAIGYRLRLDSFDFGVGHKTITRDAVLASANDVTSRETTRSQLHEWIAAIDLARPVATSWTLSAGGEVSPFTLGRLAVHLPDKYPGNDPTFVAKAFGASGRVMMTRSLGVWRLGIGADAGRTWSYHATDSVRLTTIGASVSIVRRW